MDKQVAISQMKAQLLADVATLCDRNDRHWSRPIAHTLRDIREENVEAVLFGGTLRSLLLSRIQKSKFGRPRDIDIVIAGASLDKVRDRFQQLIKRETRFGGLQLERRNWQFDVWPLHNTWAFQQDLDMTPAFEALPSTTFFNLEAIAVDVWTPPGQPRNIYSGNDQFFEGIIDRVLEINLEDNPFPALCIVRAFVFASTTQFAIGPGLATYLVHNASLITDEELAVVQQKHYGCIRCDVRTMRQWLDYTMGCLSQNGREPIALPFARQMELWNQDEPPSLKCHLFSESEFSTASCYL